MTVKILRSMTSYVVCIGIAFGYLTDALAHEEKRSHLHVGGPLSHQPFVLAMQTWYRDIVYDDSTEDLNQTSLDIYTPEPARPNAPVMVFLHGGGLVMGDKAASKDLDPKPEYFTSKLGYIFVSANYRLLPEGLHPRNVQDVANAVAWVHDNIADFGGDPDQIFLMGHSSAAELAVRVATDPEFLNNAGKDFSVIKGVIPNDGIYGVPGAEPTDPDRMQKRYGPNWQQITVVSRISKAENIPPFLILHVSDSSAFRVDTKKHALGLAEALRTADIQVEVVEFDHVGHMGANERIGEPGDFTGITIERFLGSITGNPQPAKWTPTKMPR